MDDFAKELNTLFISTYRSITKVEEAMLKTLSAGSLTIREMHIIESIGKGGNDGVNITDIAQEMQITLPSVTIAIKKLENKGYVTKDRSREDGRRVYVHLTEAGRRAEVAHRYFHRQMLKAVCAKVSQEQRPVLIEVIRALNEFLQGEVEQFENCQGRTEH